jgi:DNA-binding NarL/FixJ family response regulator
MSERLRVLVVDDHPLFRFGVCTLLEVEPGIEVVGEAASGANAISAAAALRPDVVVMDLHLPDLSGIQATRHIVAECPGTGVLMLTMADESESVFAAMRAGARGYLLKDAEPDEIIRAVQAVARGEAIFGPDVANRVLGFFNQPPPVNDPVFPELTGREREVLSLIAAGQRRHREHAVPEPEDGAQPHLERLREAARRGPGRGDRPRPRSRARARLTRATSGHRSHAPGTPRRAG